MLSNCNRKPNSETMNRYTWDHVHKISNLVNPSTKIERVNLPFDPVCLWKGHILTACCFQRPLTSCCDLMECMPTTEEGNRSLESFKIVPQGKWPLDTGPPASAGAETHKCCSSSLFYHTGGSGDRCEPKKRSSCLWLRHGIHIYTVYASRGDVFAKDVCKIICACVCVCVSFFKDSSIYTQETMGGENWKLTFFFALQYFTQEYEKWTAI